MRMSVTVCAKYLVHPQIGYSEKRCSLFNTINDIADLLDIRTGSPHAYEDCTKELITDDGCFIIVEYPVYAGSTNVKLNSLQKRLMKQARAPYTLLSEIEIKKKWELKIEPYWNIEE